MSDRPYVRLIRWPNLNLAEGGIRGAVNSISSHLRPCILSDSDVLRVRNHILENFLGRSQALRYGRSAVGTGGDGGRYR